MVSKNLLSSNRTKKKVSDNLEATQYPFASLISPENNKMVKVRNIEGLRSAEELVDILRRNTGRLDGTLAAIRAEKYAPQNVLNSYEDVYLPSHMFRHF
jgi:hypothetical protein